LRERIEQGVGRRTTGIVMSLIILSSLVTAVIILPDEGFAYVSHTPIRINSNSDFQIGVNGVVAGTGSAGDPYLISAWEIDANNSVGIYIGNTTVHFLISNVYVHQNAGSPFHTGIHMTNVQNGRVSSSVLSGNLSYCVYVEQSSAVSITNSNMSALYSNAIYANTVEGLTVSENDFYRCYGSGVTVAYSNNTNVSGNEFIQTRNSVYALVSTNCTIESNRVQGVGSSALWVATSRNASITRNNISNEFRGIFVTGTSYDVLVQGNTVTDVDYSIATQNAARLTIRDNTIIDPDNAGNWGSYGSYGMYLLSMTNSRIWNNTMTHCGIGFYGQVLADYNTHDISQNNTVNGRPVLYLKNQTGASIDGQDLGQVMLANCSQTTCANLDVSDADIGILIAFSNGITVQDCSIRNNSYAQVLMRSNRNVNLSFSDFSGGLYGVLSFSTYGSSSNISFFRSAVLNSTYDGIHLMYTTQTSIMYSNVSGHGQAGAWLEECNWGNISLSKFSNNIIGLYLDECMYFKVWWNEFINNTHHAYDTYANIWDDGYPNGGNYWDNYTGLDEKWGGLQQYPGSDGIGDTPLYIDPNSFDQYPLMQPIPEFRELTALVVVILGLIVLVRTRRRSGRQA